VDDPEQWRWVWMVATAVFLLGEMASPGSFFLLPFGIGAAAATVLAFLDVSVAVEWVVFVAVSVGVFAALRPLARRLDQQGTVTGVGAKRLIGEIGSVIEPIGGHGDLGMVRVHREEWRAETVDEAPLETGTRVRVVEVKGTRVVVWPVDLPDPPALGREPSA